MNINELIDACGGPEKVGIQFLDNCATSLNYNIKSGTKITFGTEQPLTPKGTRDHGIVVWLDRDLVATAIAKIRESQP